MSLYVPQEMILVLADWQDEDGDGLIRCLYVVLLTMHRLLAELETIFQRWWICGREVCSGVELTSRQKTRGIEEK
jgi:hypothetical protein